MNDECGNPVSLILEALSRSQRERASGSDIPGIETQHEFEPMSRSRSWQSVLPWLGLGLALPNICHGRDCLYFKRGEHNRRAGWPGGGVFIHLSVCLCDRRLHSGPRAILFVTLPVLNSDI